MRPVGRRWRILRSVAMVGVLIAITVFWTGCSVKKHYKLLSFFFDDVPTPDAPQGAGNQPSRAMRLRGAMPPQPPNVTYYGHKPFVDQKCASCHQGGPANVAATLDSKLCLGCHEQVRHKHKVIHGPVAHVACLWCHTAHESPYAHLLRASPYEVCTQCHNPNLLTDRVMAHQQAMASCTDCHLGHGGEDHRQLREPPTPSVPITGVSNTRDPAR